VGLGEDFARETDVVTALVGTYHIGAVRLQPGGVSLMAPAASKQAEARRSRFEMTLNNVTRALLAR
jgi:hypothetical protein